MQKIDHYLPNLKESWILAIILTIAGGFLTSIIKLSLVYSIPYNTEYIDFLLYPIAFIPVAIYIIKSSKKITEFRPKISINDSNFGEIGRSISFLITIPMIIAISIIIEPLTFIIKMPDFFLELITLMERYKIFAIISVVIFAPILEEILCRGFILRGLLSHTTPQKAILWSSIIFAVIHLNPWQAIPAFIFGLLIGWVYWRTGSLILAIFMHAVNNGISIIILFAFPHLPKDATLFSLMPLNYYILLYFVASIFLATTIFLMNKYYSRAMSLEFKYKN